MHPHAEDARHLNKQLFVAMNTKTLFVVGLICVVLGLLSFVVRIPHAEQEQFQSGSITLGVSRTEPRRFPVGVGGTFIIGGLALMVVGCRERVP